MPYKKIEGEKLPISVKRQIVALCGDYKRRESEILRDRRRREVLLQYKAINELIKASADEVCPYESEDVKRALIISLGEIRGYNSSPLCMMMSAAAYYRRKELLTRKIAERLNLL